jgi:hypothetical protein
MLVYVNGFALSAEVSEVRKSRALGGKIKCLIMRDAFTLGDGFGAPLETFDAGYFCEIDHDHSPFIDEYRLPAIQRPKRIDGMVSDLWSNMLLAASRW